MLTVMLLILANGEVNAASCEVHAVDERTIARAEVARLLSAPDAPADVIAELDVLVQAWGGAATRGDLAGLVTVMTPEFAAFTGFSCAAPDATPVVPIATPATPVSVATFQLDQVRVTDDGVVSGFVVIAGGTFAEDGTESDSVRFVVGRPVDGELRIDFFAPSVIFPDVSSEHDALVVSVTAAELRESGLPELPADAMAIATPD